MAFFCARGEERTKIKENEESKILLELHVMIVAFCGQILVCEAENGRGANTVEVAFFSFSPFPSSKQQTNQQSVNSIILGDP